MTPTATRAGSDQRGRRYRAVLADEQGSAAVELTLLTPLLIVVLLFIVLAARLADARSRLDDAAHEAARAASLARSIGQATTAAQATAQTALASAGIVCRDLSVKTDTAGLRPGGTVTVTVSCTAGLGDLTVPGFPGSMALQSRFSSVVDVYRGVGNPPSGGGG